MLTQDGRRRVGWIAGAVAVVLVLAVFAFLVQRVGRVPTAGSGEPPAAGPLKTLEMAPELTTPPPAPSASATPASSVRGPLDILIVGVDTRVSIPGWQPHADAVLLLHLPSGSDRGYLFSLPRDLVVDVPAYPEADFAGGRMKLTEAMARGSRVAGGGRADVRKGLGLLSRTVSAYTGIRDFDASAVLTFTGLSRLTNALGGVTLRIDQRVVSQHMRPDGKHRAAKAGGGGYVGPQMVYQPGTRALVGWQAIDYARQRYTAGGDYTRQRHQQQLIKALLTKARSSGIAGDTARLDAVLRALGDTLVFDGEGQDPVAFAYALRDLKPSDLTLVGLPGAGVGSGSGYRGEQLRKPGRDFLAAVRAGKVAAFLRTHPEMINKI
jgi:LCP family protein required for cell wall assembly